MKKVVVLIPARLKSTRFPEKPLALIHGKEMILHVAEKAALAVGVENVYVATDSEKISSVVEDSGYQSVMTSSNALTGTDRLAEAAVQINADIYINVQGDEPMVNPSDIKKIIESKLNNPTYVINGMHKLGPNEDPDDVNIPKVIINEQEQLVYMSRRALPGFKSDKKKPKYYLKQICIYAFDRNQLEQFVSFDRKSYLENYEDIEILRFLELGIPIKMVETETVSLAVDIPSDIKLVEAALCSK